MLYGGKSTRTHGPEIREKVGLVFQDADACLLGQTVWDDLMYGPENLGFPLEKRNEQGEKLLKDFGLWDKKALPPRFLSGGEKKRLTLAGILIMNPDIIILDEPFVGLDFPAVQALLRIIISLKEEQKTLIIISHDLEKILAHAERLIILDGGRITADAPPEDLAASLPKWGIRRPPERRVSQMTWLESHG